MRSTPPYRARECARLAGVTVKALYHYERLGLLTPARTNAGYRVYSAKDLQRLDEILALKFVGLPLDQIKALLDSPARSLAEALRAQRRRLKIERRRITRAMRAIRDAERRLTADGQPALERASDASILAMLIDVIEAGDELDAMRKYFTDAAWPKARDYFAEWPSPAWRDLLRDVQAALSDDPAGDRAQALCARWNTLFMGDAAGDIAFRTGLWNAWVDRRQWPPALADRVAMYDMDRIVRFIQESSWATIQDDGRPRAADAMRAPDRVSPTRIALFQEIARALRTDASGRAARTLVERWHALLDRESGGDPEIRSAVTSAWQSRAHWPAGMRRYVGALYEMDFSTWEQVASCIEHHAPR